MARMGCALDERSKEPNRGCLGNPEIGISRKLLPFCSVEDLLVWR